MADRFDLKFRLIVTSPPADVAFALQSGGSGAGLIHPTRATSEAIVFNLRVHVDKSSERTVKLSSPVVQGDAQRFVCLNSGTLAGQTDSKWGRTARVPLNGLTRQMIDQAHDTGGVLEIEVAGSADDGGPADGTVALHGGWRLGRP